MSAVFLLSLACMFLSPPDMVAGMAYWVNDQAYNITMPENRMHVYRYTNLGVCVLTMLY